MTLTPASALSSGKTKDPDEQNRRLEHLPGSLPLAVKTLRRWGFVTTVAWKEKDKGDGLSQVRLTVIGDAGQNDYDGYRICTGVNYYKLKYSRRVEEKKPDRNVSPDADVKKGMDNMPEPLKNALYSLKENDFQPVSVRLPSDLNDRTAMRFRSTLIKGDRFVVEDIEVERCNYKYSFNRRHAFDDYDNPRIP